MKTASYSYTIAFLLLLWGFNAFAQSEVKTDIELKLTDSITKTSHSYKLYAASYSLSNPFYQSDEIRISNSGSCTMNLDLGQDPDKFLLKWLAGAVKSTSGEITMVTISDIKKLRKMAFTGGTVVGSSEGFYSSNASNASAQISFYVETLAIDGTNVFTTKKQVRSQGKKML